MKVNEEQEPLNKYNIYISKYKFYYELYRIARKMTIQ